MGTGFHTEVAVDTASCFYVAGNVHIFCEAKGGSLFLSLKLPLVPTTTHPPYNWNFCKTWVYKTNSQPYKDFKAPCHASPAATSDLKILLHNMVRTSVTRWSL